MPVVLLSWNEKQMMGVSPAAAFLMNTAERVQRLFLGFSSFGLPWAQ